MIRILVIDDEPINYHLVVQALQPPGYEIEYAENGNRGISKALQSRPDLIITDVMMPDISGYEVTRLLRREDQFANTPILILTAQAGLQDKLKAFEAGADDHITKPFSAAELSVRVAALLRRVQATQSPVQEVAHGETARMIAVHSLRGGTGSSTLAVNFAVGLAALWPRSTILLDLTMTAGQVALMLNMTLRRTWADVARFKPDELDRDALQSVIGLHESGLSFIAAPTFPTEAQTLSDETLGTALSFLKQDYEYLVADLPHDFSGVALQALDAADIILMVASPEMASVRAVTAALDTYLKLGYPKEKMKLVLSATFPHAELMKEKIDAALGMTSIATIPYVQEVFVDAINYGRPPVYYQTGLPISGLLEDFAFHLSKDTHKKTKPDNPTDAWKRVYKRYQERKR